MGDCILILLGVITLQGSVQGDSGNSWWQLILPRGHSRLRSMLTLISMPTLELRRHSSGMFIETGLWQALAPNICEVISK